jgi:hypothetical protein
VASAALKRQPAELDYFFYRGRKIRIKKLQPLREKADSIPGGKVRLGDTEK